MTAACRAGTVLLLLMAACSNKSASDLRQSNASAGGYSSADSRFEITATIKELMASTIDPAADVLWGAVATNATLAGTEEKQPRTQEDWQSVRYSAVTLMEAMNLLVMDGRHPAPPGTTAGEGELSPADIDEQIAANRAAFAALAHGLRAATQKALTAIDHKDAPSLFDAGGEIDEACEACHITFWYPKQKAPGS